MPIAKVPAKLYENPGDDAVVAPLVSLIESSLQIERLRGWTNVAKIRPDEWTTLPFTLVGQSPQGPIEVELEGQPPMRHARGAGYILPEGVRHRLNTFGVRERVYHWTHLRLRVLGEVDLFHFIASPGAVAPRVGRQIGRIGLAMSRLAERAALATSDGAGATSGPSLIAIVAERRRLCSELLSIIVRHSTPRPRAWQTLSLISRMLPVLRFMRDHLARPVMREELTALAGLSASRFHALFLAATGLPPQQFLIRLRLRSAQEELISTDRPIHEIAESVGFRDPFHFSRTFTRFAGLSPRRYRRRIGETIAVIR